MNVRTTGAAREALIAAILKLDDLGLRGGEIADRVGKSPMTVSVILRENGRRKKTRGVRISRPRPTKIAACSNCGAEHLVRADRRPPYQCSACRPTFKRGRVPHNKGKADRQVPRTCPTCQKPFFTYRSNIDRRSPDGFKYAYGTYCSRPCYAIAQRTPGSRYSQAGKGRWR